MITLEEYFDNIGEANGAVTDAKAKAQTLKEECAAAWGRCKIGEIHLIPAGSSHEGKKARILRSHAEKAGWSESILQIHYTAQVLKKDGTDSEHKARWSESIKI